MPKWKREVDQDFIKAMQAKLDEKSHKSAPLKLSFQVLCMLLQEEADELYIAFEHDATPEEIVKECADVANFAMFIAQKVKKEAK